MTGTTLTVPSGAGAYAVHIGPGLLEGLGEAVRAVSGAKAAALIADTNVSRLLGVRAADSLARAGFRVESVAVAPGEPSKSWAEAGAVLETLSERRIGRDDVVVALGGGVVGDLAGFCAATYMRGVGLVQVPTTLLAQVDSSIGGKTGVDLPRGKNLAGAFWPPMVVLADTAVLDTLSDADWRSGLAEVAKSAILDGKTSVEALFAEAEALRAREAAAVGRAVAMAAGLKVRTVSADERESGVRESLNLGHTLGHALEQVAGYGAVAHGEAVAEGIRFAARLAERTLGTDAGWSERQGRLLSALGLPETGCPYGPAALLEAMRSDKKSRAGAVRFVFARGPGDWVVEVVDDEVLADGLEAWCRG